MAKKKDFLYKISSLVDTSWSTLRSGHSVGAYDDRYPCANPDGPVDNSDCPDDEPLCNCPCQELMPTQDASWWDFFGWFDTEQTEEPTEEEMEEALESIKECEYIESALGSDYLGCLWNNTDHPCSCDCPCRGEKFGEYLDYTRTYATYWNTPENTPLWREAQMFLINAQTATVVLNGDLSLRPGTLIRIINKMPGVERDRRFTGRWLVTSISHMMDNESHRMLIGLSRDSTAVPPDESEILGWFESTLGWLGSLF